MACWKGWNPLRGDWIKHLKSLRIKIHLPHLKLRQMGEMKILIGNKSTSNQMLYKILSGQFNTRLPYLTTLLFLRSVTFYR
jgi:hypothetical protein